MKPARIIDQAILDALQLGSIDEVVFYKRDEITTDLICCDVVIGDMTWFFHEELPGWSSLIHHLTRLSGFRADWYVAVANSPFALSETVAYRNLDAG